MRPTERLKQGEFNSMAVFIQGDGSELITLTKDGDAHRYILHIRNRGRPNEELLEERTEP